MSRLNVLVVGASVAGPTAAYWFAKAGANVTIIERFPRMRTAGQNIDIRTAGVTVMRKMPGMEAAVRAKITPMDGISFVHENGKPFATMIATGDAEQQSLISEYEIFRGELANILFDLTKDNKRVKYVFGEQIESVQQPKKDGPLTVKFANGLPTSDYDLVVACDGATSRTRALGLDCGVRDHINPLNAWAAYFSIKPDLLNGTKTGQSFSTVGGRWLAVGPDPSGVTRVVLMSIHPRNEPDATLPFREAAKQGDDALRKHIAQRFAGAGWKTDEIMSGLMDSDDFYASEIVQVKVPSITHGRFALVGDAGYAAGPTGTGTSLALAGAYVLAGEIAAHKGDLTAGLKAYEERMRPIIADMQVIPPGVPGIFAPQTAWGIYFRNWLFTLVAGGMSLGKYFSWVGGLFASGFGKDKYGLPDYDWEE